MPCQLIFIDVQEKLFVHIHEYHRIEKELLKLTEIAHLLQLPISVTEQYPKGLGPTITSLKAKTTHARYFSKTAFSCMQDLNFRDWVLQQPKDTEWVLVGIEAHICVYLTACDLLNKGLPVTVISDLVGSRNPLHLQEAWTNLRHKGASILNLETWVFNKLKDCQHPQFKQVANLFKS